VRSLGRKPTPTQVNRERTEIEVPRARWTQDDGVERLADACHKLPRSTDWPRCL